MVIKRREFFQAGSLATASLLLPRFLKAFERPAIVPHGNKAVVVLQLSGGNDGLNTVIPVRNDIYYRERPRLGIDKTHAALITDEAGLHPALSGLKGLYDDGSLGILNSVGYPNPDRSHFRSMDIWQTASDSREYLQTGWLGRYLDAQCSSCDHPTQALEIDDVVSMALKGDKIRGMALKDPHRLYQISNDRYFRDVLAGHSSPAGKTAAGGPGVHGGNEGGAVDYLYK